MKIIKALILAALVAVGLGCGYSSKTMATQPGTMPAIIQLNPASASAGGASFLFEVDGTGFAANAVIDFNGAAQRTTFMSSTRLQTTIPASAIMNTATVPVTVTNPGTAGGLYGGGTMAETSAAMNFTIN